MRFTVFRSSEGSVAAKPPCVEALRGPEAPAWPGEYTWYVEIEDLEALLRFMEDHGGGVAVYAAEEGEDAPALEIFDDDEDDE